MNESNQAKSNDGQGPDNISSMSDKEKDKWNPRKFLLETRQDAMATSSSVEQHNESISLDILIAQCHGLVVTNQEIWERCQPFHCTTLPSYDDDTQPHDLMIYRVGYWTIRSRRTRETLFVVESPKEVMKSSFEIPIHLPAQLECLLPLAPKVKHTEPKYELLLKRSMLLADEVLLGFLLEFRAFLEKRQVALGKVDSWLFQPKEHADFLRDHFGVTVSCDDYFLSRNITSWHACKNMLHNHTCSRCEEDFENHVQYDQEGWVYCRRGCEAGSFLLREAPTKLLEYPCTRTMDFNLCIENPEVQSLLVQLLKILRNNLAPPR